VEDFDKFAHDYKTILDKTLKYGGEKEEYFSAYKADCINRCVGNNFSGKILDYGCGVGLLSKTLLKKFPQSSVDGYDISTTSIEHVPNYIKEQGHFTSDMNTLNQDYDLIVVANVLHHIKSPIRESVVTTFSKLIKNKGKIIIFEHNPFNPLTCKIVRDSLLDKGVVLLPFSETLYYLKKAGFKNIRLSFIVFFPRFLSALRWAEPLLFWFPLGAQYTAIGEIN